MDDGWRPGRGRGVPGRAGRCAGPGPGGVATRLPGDGGAAAHRLSGAGGLAGGGHRGAEPEWLGYALRLSRTVRRPAEAERLQNYARAGETSAAFRTGGHLAQAVAAISDPTTDVRLVTLDIGGDDLLALLQGPGARSGGAGRRRRGR